MPTNTLMRFGNEGGSLFIEGIDRARRPACAVRNLILLRQLEPLELLINGIAVEHHTPIVDCPGGAWRDAIHAVVAFGRIDDVVVVVVGDGVDRAGFLARVATDADFRVDNVLFGGRHGAINWLNQFVGSTLPAVGTTRDRTAPAS